MPRLHLTLLGGFQVRLDTGPAVLLTRKKAQALLAYLVVEPGEAHLRDKLAALLWGDSSDQRARQSLRQTLLTLKQALPQTEPELLRVDADAVAVNRQAVEADVIALEQLVATATPEALTQAAALCTGDFLEGLGVQEPRFEEWLIRERERLRELALEALARLLAHQTKSGAAQAAIHTAGRLLTLDPLQEAVHRALMRLYARQGRRGAALRQYQICVAVLQRELGVEPEAATKELYEEILQTQLAASAVHSSPELADNPVAQSQVETLADAAVPDAPLVGRGAQMAALLRLRAQAWRGRARIGAVVGEAGIGKSRLIDALVTDTLHHGGRALVGRAHETERILPFGPWVDAVRTSGVLSELARQPGLSAWRVQLARLFPELARPGRDQAAKEEDHARLFEAMAQAVGHLSVQQPLLLVLEDIHWADDMSLRLLAYLSRRGATSPVLFVATMRAEEVIDTPPLRRLLRELASDQHFVSLTLAPLSALDTVSLVRSLARTGTDEPAVQRLGTQIWRASEGNPFMVVETMRALDATNARGESDELPTPARVRETIAARLDRLSQRGRDLTALASVIGRDFDFTLLECAAGVDGRDTAAAVEELVARHVLHAVDERLDFTHDRIREVAYERLLAPRRKLLHATVAGAMETVYAEDLAPYYVGLSRHCQRGALWDKALTYLRNAGATAAARAAHREAVTCFEQALAALQHLPESHSSQEQSIDLRFALRNSLAALGEHGQVLNHLRAAETTARALGDRRRLGWVSAYRTNSLFFIGENQSAITSGERARSLAEDLGDTRLHVVANLVLGQACHAVGQFAREANLLRQNIRSLEHELLRRGDSPSYQVYSRCYLAHCLAELGEFSEGVTCSTEALKMAEATDQTYPLVHACFVTGVVYLRKGTIALAVPVLERCLQLCHGREFPVLASVTHAVLGYAYALSGRLSEALPLMETAVDALAHSMRGAALAMIYLGEGYLAAGRRRDAAALADRALDLTLERHERGNQTWALRLRGEIAAHAAPLDIDGAEAAYRGAIELASELGMSPLRAQCHLGRGQCYRRAGRADEARAQLSAASDLFRSMGMAYWLPYAEAGLPDMQRSTPLRPPPGAPASGRARPRHT